MTCTQYRKSTPREKDIRQALDPFPSRKFGKASMRLTQSRLSRTGSPGFSTLPCSHFPSPSPQHLTRGKSSLLPATLDPTSSDLLHSHNHACASNPYQSWEDDLIIPYPPDESISTSIGLPCETLSHRPSLAKGFDPPHTRAMETVRTTPDPAPV